MPKLPDYDERSAHIAQVCADLDRKMIEEVSSVIRESLKESAKELVNLTKSDDESIRLQAVKHHLKLGGLEVDRTEVNNKGTMSLTISPEQAARVVSAGQ